MHIVHTTISAPDPTSFIPKRWYAVHIRSRFEKVVQAQLLAQEVEHYLAVFRETHQWQDRKKLVEVPLFPGYIFARFQDVEAARIPVLRTNGVARVLGIGGSIEPIPDQEIDSIRQLLQSGNQFFPHPFIREGCWVRVKRGMLAGIEGRLIRMKSQARLVLSVEILSQSVATEVDVRDVEPILGGRPRRS